MSIDIVTFLVTPWHTFYMSDNMCADMVGDVEGDVAGQTHNFVLTNAETIS